MGKLLKRVKIFDTANSPNGIAFASGDAQTIAQETNAAMAGGHRIPLKAGHTSDDSAPALGWVAEGSVTASGSGVYADLHLTDEAQRLCASGAYRNMSIELLRDVNIDGTNYSMLLDAVALLGAAQPAVRTLDDLQKLAASRHAVEAICFASSFTLPVEEPKPKARKSADAGRHDFAEVMRLRTERDEFARRAEVAEAAAADLRRKIDSETFARKAEDYVRSGRVTPGMRDLIQKRMKDPATAQTFSAVDMLDSVALAPGTHGYAPGLVTGKLRAPGGDNLDNPVPELAMATREYAKANNCDVFTAMGAVAKLRRDLVEPVMVQFQRSRGR